MTLRDEIVEFLRNELIGPRPGLPFVQLDGEEVLSPDDPPRLRYGAGILFPSALNVEVQQDDSTAEELPGDADNREDEGVFRTIESELSGVIHPDQDARGEGENETDYEVGRANEFLPSALGITFLARLPEQLVICVRAAQYYPVELPGDTWTKSDGKVVARKHWFRKPLDQQVSIDRKDLLGKGARVIRRGLEVANEGTRLELHVFSRPVSGAFPEGEADDRFITVTLINRTLSSDYHSDEKCFFQCGIMVSTQNNDACFLEYPERQADELSSPEDLSLELLYRHRRIFAVGHGCAADWDESLETGATEIFSTSLPEYEIRPILPSALDEVDLRMRTLALEDNGALESCHLLADKYESWIGELEQGVSVDLPQHLRSAAEENINQCGNCLARIRRGIKLLEQDEEVAKAFRLMNKSMLMQHVHYDLSTSRKRKWVASGNGLALESSYQPPDYENSDRSWRPFQLAFVLMTIRSIVLAEPEDFEERDTVDLIWFPTGGGKTEAYLGLTAFTIFFRRLRNPKNAGTTALMRYTLRLLTTQQYQRAASLICACEIIRRDNQIGLGDIPLTIGLWVGGSVTPNTEKAAQTALTKLMRGDRENPFIILACPWCGAQMGPVKQGKATRTPGYRKLTAPNRVRLVCEDPACDFCTGEGLPLQIIDEHIYEEPPTLCIGTVDKFALLPWYPRARRLFGIGIEAYDPPDLIIQDELHLISGPLGSMVGHYETVIDALSRRDRDDLQIPAKIVASTATISRASEQIMALYGGRKSFLFPPQGLKAGDSYFAKECDDKAGRKYVGVFATGLPSLTTTEVRVLASLLQAPKYVPHDAETDLDPYWTLMIYFNSIRELGHAATLVRADVDEYMRVCWKRLGLTSAWGDNRAGQRRFINVDMELTSRVQNSEITEYMDRLFEKYDGTRNSYPVDVCLATNMIQVGLDVSRLSLMAIIGQPKTTAEYIQASSRVGRSGEGPGLVVTLLSPAKPRDRSHAEHFRAYHQSIYRYVEPTSLTPFAIPVTERALHALIITLARFWSDDADSNRADPPGPALEARIKEVISRRTRLVEPKELQRVEALMDSIFSEWHRLPPDAWGGFTLVEDSVPFMYPSGMHPHEAWDKRAYATPSSMRNVDAGCNANILTIYRV